MRRAGLQSVVWTADAADWQPDGAEEIAARALAGATPGSILLLHERLDDFPDLPPAGRQVEVAERVLTGLAGQGRRSTTVGALVDAGRARRSAWFRP
jgi:hypothetical protein